jgi:predicted Rossmann-fold nucleotide-binding protein
VLYNVEGYWDGILQWVTKAVDEKFIASDNKSIMVEARSGEEVVERLNDYQNAEGRFNLQWHHK